MEDIDFESVFDASPALLLLLSPTLQIVAASDAYMQATMTTRERLIGVDLFEAFPDNPDDPGASGVANLRASLTHVLETRQPDRMPIQKYDMRGPNGVFEERYWSPLNSPVLGPDGAIRYIIHQVEDVTAQERAIREESLRTAELQSTEQRLAATRAQIVKTETALLAAERRLEVTLHAGEVGTWLWDVVADVVVADPNLARMYGLSAAEAAGAPLSRYMSAIHPDDRERIRDEFSARLKDGGAYQTEYRLAQEDGTTRTVLARGRVEHDSSGNVTGLPGVVLDISQRAELEAERRKLAETNVQLLAAERAARSEAERVGRVKDEFLATLSHELRTPLNAILGWAQLLRQKPNPETIADGLDVIERNAQLQKRLIEDLLDMSRIIAGKVRLDVQLVSLKEIIDAAVLAIEPAARAKNIGLTTVLDTGGGRLWGDPNRLQQIVWNLLTNAIKFTATHGQIEVVLQRVKSRLEIRVTDTGSGIDPEFLPHVFERFRQSDGSITRSHGGLGLGLAIVRTLVELHGGTIAARSSGVGKGAAFVVSLPQSIGDPHRPQTRRERFAPLGGDPVESLTYDPALLLGLKVLVVDDEPDSRTLVGRILTEFSAEVTLAGSAQEALALLSTVRPDVLLSDIGMPEVDGYELIRQVRKLGRENGGAVHAAALTALARPEDRTRALLAGYQTHIAKPVDAMELVAAVAALAGRTGTDRDE